MGNSLWKTTKFIAERSSWPRAIGWWARNVNTNRRFEPIPHFHMLFKTGAITIGGEG